MNWFPLLVTVVVAGVPLLGFKNPGQALALLLTLGVVLFVWMAMDVWKTLRSTQA